MAKFINNGSGDQNNTVVELDATFVLFLVLAIAVFLLGLKAIDHMLFVIETRFIALEQRAQSITRTLASPSLFPYYAGIAFLAIVIGVGVIYLNRRFSIFNTIKEFFHEEDDYYY